MQAKHNSAFKTRRLRAVTEDLNSSAATLARKALEDLIDYADACQVETITELLTEVKELAELLAQARPSRLVVRNLIEVWLQTLPELPEDLDRARGRLGAHSEEIIDLLLEAQAQLIARCQDEIKPNMTLMTLSNSSNVVSLIRNCHLANKNIKVIITESRPSMEGRRLARYLNKLGVHCIYITEAQMASFVVQADKVILGADTVLRDGSIISKAGSRLLALAAKDAGIPVWVLAESYKHSLVYPEDAVLEEVDTLELQLEEMPHIEMHNVYFDLVPARLISTWVDEQRLSVEFQSRAEALKSNLPQVLRTQD